MRADKLQAEMQGIIDDCQRSKKSLDNELKNLRDKHLRLRNGLCMLLVAESWEEQPGPVLTEYVNNLLKETAE